MFDRLSIYMADGEYVIYHLWLVMPSPFTDHPFPRSVEHIYGLSSMTYIILTFPHFCCLHLSTLRGRCWFLSSLVGFIIKITCLLLGEIWTCFRWFSSQPCLITRGDNWWFQSIEIHVFLCYFLSNNLNMNWNPYHFFPDYSSLIHVMCFFGQIMSNSSMVHVCQTTCPYKSNEIPPKKNPVRKTLALPIQRSEKITIVSSSGGGWGLLAKNWRCTGWTQSSWDILMIADVGNGLDTTIWFNYIFKL